MKSRHLIVVFAAALTIAPAIAAEPADAWTRRIVAETGEFVMDHRDGLSLQCSAHGGVIRVTLPGVHTAPVFVTAGTERATLLETAADATHTRGVLLGDFPVISAIVEASAFEAAGRTWALESAKDKRDVGLFFRICKAAA